MFASSESQDYKPLPAPEEESFLDDHRPRSTTVSKKSILYILSGLLCLFLAFAAGALSVYISGKSKHCPELNNVAPRIPISLITGEFISQSPFSKEPPSGPGSGDIAEPIWDALIPNGLGYFHDQTLAPTSSIPTVFHQLHCLYLLRRAYYSEQGDGALERFDFGKNRSSHVAHCFDYLVQGLVCSADTTVEPAVDKEHGFLGSGFARQCRDFGALKGFVQERKVFNATGFLAEGHV